MAVGVEHEELVGAGVLGVTPVEDVGKLDPGGPFVSIQAAVINIGAIAPESEVRDLTRSARFDVDKGHAARKGSLHVGLEAFRDVMGPLHGPAGGDGHDHVHEPLPPRFPGP